MKKNSLRIMGTEERDETQSKAQKIFTTKSWKKNFLT